MLSLWIWNQARHAAYVTRKWQKLTTWLTASFNVVEISTLSAWSGGWNTRYRTANKSPVLFAEQTGVRMHWKNWKKWPNSIKKSYDKNEFSLILQTIWRKQKKSWVKLHLQIDLLSVRVAKSLLSMSRSCSAWSVRRYKYANSALREDIMSNTHLLWEHPPTKTGNQPSTKSSSHLAWISKKTRDYFKKCSRTSRPRT